MAKEIKWECLTSDEAKTLNELRNNGKEVYAAPIEIEHSEQLVSLGISWSQCRTWFIIGMSGLRFISPRLMKPRTASFLESSIPTTVTPTVRIAAWFPAKHG